MGKVMKLLSLKEFMKTLEEKGKGHEIHIIDDNFPWDEIVDCRKIEASPNYRHCPICGKNQKSYFGLMVYSVFIEMILA